MNELPVFKATRELEKDFLTELEDRELVKTFFNKQVFSSVLSFEGILHKTDNKNFTNLLKLGI